MAMVRVLRRLVLSEAAEIVWRGPYVILTVVPVFPQCAESRTRPRCSCGGYSFGLDNAIISPNRRDLKAKMTAQRLLQVLAGQTSQANDMANEAAQLALIWLRSIEKPRQSDGDAIMRVRREPGS